MNRGIRVLLIIIGTLLAIRARPFWSKITPRPIRVGILGA
jgi:hypothetical protein